MPTIKPWTDKIGLGHFYLMPGIRGGIRKGKPLNRNQSVLPGIVLFITCVFLLGCKGPAGSDGTVGLKGEVGPIGPQGDTTPTTEISGLIPSNAFTVTNSALRTDRSVSVMIGSFALNQWVELPYFLPLQGINTFYILHDGSIEIFNGVSSGYVSYRIFIVSTSPQLRHTTGKRLLW